MYLPRLLSRWRRKGALIPPISAPVSAVLGQRGFRRLTILAFGFSAAYVTHRFIPGSGLPGHVQLAVADCHSTENSAEPKEEGSACGTKKSAPVDPSVCLKALTRQQPSQQFELTAEAENKIKREISSYDVVLFMKGNASRPACKYSRHALDILKNCRTPTIRTVNVLEDKDLRNGIKRFSSYPYIPQLYVRGKFIGGIDRLLAMHKDGSLQKMLRVY